MRLKQSDRGNLLVLVGIGVLASAAAPLDAQAQDTPPGRSIFKCQNDGQITYTDSPCLGGQRIATGSWPSQVAMAMAPKPYGIEHRWAGVAHTPRAECPHLAQRIALVEAEERAATAETVHAVQERLSIQRARYRELGC